MDSDQLREYFGKNKLQVILALMGLFLLVVGVGVSWNRLSGGEEAVEIMPAGEDPEGKTEYEGKIVVDVEGAVESPGVYELEGGARVNDALTAAGGMAEDADRIWMRRYVNLAQKIPDGAKIYVPMEGESYNEQSQISNIKNQNDTGSVAGVTTGEMESGAEGKVNINTASKSELDALWGIGEARAEAIIANRPYSSIEELGSRAGIPANVLETNKEKLTIY